MLGRKRRTFSNPSFRRNTKYSCLATFIILGLCFHHWNAQYAVLEPYEIMTVLAGNEPNNEPRSFATSKSASAGKTTTLTSSTTQAKPWNKNNNVIIIKEEDHNLATSQVPRNHANFTIEYFSSMPECTPLQPHQVSFTLTTQLSSDRLWIMKHQCERWPSPLPIAIALYLPPDAPADQEKHLLDRLDQELQCDLTRMQITFFGATSPKEQYPVNVLRNLALKSITTTHAAYIDSDFLISFGLHDNLMATTRHILANNTRAAVVIPAFDYIPNCKVKKQAKVLACLKEEWETIPRRYEDILSLLDKESLPRVDRGYESIHGKNKHHGTTMYAIWTQNQTNALPIPCIKTPAYEPYLVIRVCQSLPMFPEQFKGWGFNKVVWIKILLKKLGYHLWQLPRGFVIHVPHELSASRQAIHEGHPPEFDAYLDWLTALPVHPDHLPRCYDLKKEQQFASTTTTVATIG